MKRCIVATLHRCSIAAACCSIVAALQGNAQYDRRLVDLFFDHVLRVENVGDEHSLQAAQPHRPDALAAARTPATLLLLVRPRAAAGGSSKRHRTRHAAESAQRRTLNSRATKGRDKRGRSSAGGFRRGDLVRAREGEVEVREARGRVGRRLRRLAVVV